MQFRMGVYGASVQSAKPDEENLFDGSTGGSAEEVQALQDQQNATLVLSKRNQQFSPTVEALSDFNEPKTGQRRNASTGRQGIMAQAQPKTGSNTARTQEQQHVYKIDPRQVYQRTVSPPKVAQPPQTGFTPQALQQIYIQQQKQQLQPQAKQGVAAQATAILLKKELYFPKEVLQELYQSQRFQKEPVKQQYAVIPAQQPMYKGKKTLVLDLDETLIHSKFSIAQLQACKTRGKADFQMRIIVEGRPIQVFVLIRPGVQYFLQRLALLYELVIYTASMSIYANPLVDTIDGDRLIPYRLYRDHCFSYQGSYIKDLSLLGRPMSDVIIVDNSPNAYHFHPENAVPILSWYDDPDDRCLLEMLPLLEAMASVDDVRTIIPRIVNHDAALVDFQLANQVFNEMQRPQPDIKRPSQDSGSGQSERIHKPIARRNRPSAVDTIESKQTFSTQQPKDEVLQNENPKRKEDDLLPDLSLQRRPEEDTERLLRNRKDSNRNQPTYEGVKHLQIQTTAQEFIDQKPLIQTATNASTIPGLIGSLQVISAQSTKANAAMNAPLIQEVIQEVRKQNNSNTSKINRRMRKGESESRKSLKQIQIYNEQPKDISQIAMRQQRGPVDRRYSIDKQRKNLEEEESFNKASNNTMVIKRRSQHPGNAQVAQAYSTHDRTNPQASILKQINKYSTPQVWHQELTVAPQAQKKQVNSIQNLDRLRIQPQGSFAVAGLSQSPVAVSSPIVLLQRQDIPNVTQIAQSQSQNSRRVYGVPATKGQLEQSPRRNDWFQNLPVQLEKPKEVETARGISVSAERVSAYNKKVKANFQAAQLKTTVLPNGLSASNKHFQKLQ